MPVNLDKTLQWKADIAKSVDMYNAWFMQFAPVAFRSTRIETTKHVEAALIATANLTNIKPAIIRQHPEILATLRMSTCPPLAVDRLIGLATSRRAWSSAWRSKRNCPFRWRPPPSTPSLARSQQLLRSLPTPIFSYGSGALCRDPAGNSPRRDYRG